MLIHVRLTGASILVVTHGYQVREHGDDPFVNLTSKAADDFGQASLPGRFLVDMIPARECKVVVHVFVCLALTTEHISGIYSLVATRGWLAKARRRIQSKLVQGEGCAAPMG